MNEAIIKKKKAYDAARYAANPEETRTRMKVWRTNNPEKVVIGTAAYRAANKENSKYQEKAKACRAANHAANPEKAKASDAAWAAANPEAKRIHKQNRRARKYANGGVLSRDLSVRLFKLQKGKCPCCKQPLGDDYHMDHVIPLALGGSNTDDNMQLLRSRCNLQKHASHPVDFMQQRGFLL